MDTTKEAQDLLNMASQHFKRAVFNIDAVRKTAERIAHMEKSRSIEAQHMAEAVQYRGDQFDYLKAFILEELPNLIGKSADSIQRQSSGALLDRINEVFDTDIKSIVQAITDEFFRYYHTGLRVSEVKKILARLQRKYINQKTEKALSKLNLVRSAIKEALNELKRQYGEEIDNPHIAPVEVISLLERALKVVGS